MERISRTPAINRAIVHDDFKDDDKREHIYQSSRKLYASNIGSSRISLFSRSGLFKSISKDAVVAWEKFACEEGTTFCGVFAGHGNRGHIASRIMRDKFPGILDECRRNLQAIACKPTYLSGKSEKINAVTIHRERKHGSAHELAIWKDSLRSAYKQMDVELVANGFDLHSSGTTALTVVKHGDDLIIGHVGHSRAVLGTRVHDNSVVALQLTNVLEDSSVGALLNKASVRRIFLPNKTIPGLVRARAWASGEYQLEEYHEISKPEIMTQRLSKKDEFVVLATDGIWNILTNQEVVDTVVSISERSIVAEAIVSRAMSTWKDKGASLLTEDCAVVCLFI